MRAIVYVESLIGEKLFFENGAFLFRHLVRDSQHLLGLFLPGILAPEYLEACFLSLLASTDITYALVGLFSETSLEVLLSSELPFELREYRDVHSSPSAPSRVLYGSDARSLFRRRLEEAIHVTA
jgi:hypothetical protein